MPIEAKRTAELEVRVQLAAISEPGDPITSTLIHRYGAEQTIRLAQDVSDSIPDGITPQGFEDWQTRLNTRLRTDTVQRVLDACEKRGIAVTIPGDPDWPATLDDLKMPPIALFQRGDTSMLAEALDRRIALLGAKAATSYGEHLAAETAAELANDERVIVSTGEYGISGAAHRATLSSGGSSIAVFATGLDRPYPAGHADLAERIAERGAIVSELPPGSAPTRWRMMQRGRIVAAASAVTVIVEASTRSSTLITADHARQLGRPVAAFPGPVTSIASAGTNLLIASGTAQLVTGPRDIRDFVDNDPTGTIALAATRETPGDASPERRARLPILDPAQSRPAQRPGPALGA